MYCVKCGVRLADTEKKCPLCETPVYCPDVSEGSAEALYPAGKMPKHGSGRAVLSGAVIILFMIPLLLTFFSDIFPDGGIDWFGYVAGGILLAYLVFAFPIWFRKPNPVILVPCDCIAATVYLLYLNLSTGGDWFLSFALPLSVGASVIVSALVTLLYYLRRGRLYVIGGVMVGFGLYALMIELLMSVTFATPFMGWSIYPLVSLSMIGGLLIYLAMNRVAREKIERLLFF